ncbi:MAG TPA: transketolase [Bacilli bacterium]|nr:transketolase [Bacilli bacterium]
MSYNEKIVNSLKGLSIDMINSADSGHPGIALSSAPILYTLYSRHLNINLNDFKWMNRDRFVMSAGHGSALLYSILFYCGYLNIDNLKKFREINSVTPGHPENYITPGVDMTTGPLGQGIASAVGMAIAEKYYSKTLGEDTIDYYTYVLCSDGDLMEGISYEAMSLAGNLKLGKLIVLYDSNNVSLDGSTNLSFNEDIKSRVESMGWDYLKVIDGNSIEDIDKSIIRAKKLRNKPTLIEIKTIIGNGSLLENTNLVHGKPLTDKDINQLKNKLDLPKNPYFYDDDLVIKFQNIIKNRCDENYNNWILLNEKKIDNILNKKIDVLEILKSLDTDSSLREINGNAMSIIADYLYTFIGGAADLSSSTKTILKDKGIFSPLNYKGRNIYYGVREHAMAAVSNGLALCGLKPFASTFLIFSDYMKPSIRLSAIMNLPVTYVFTHDSITIGKDGPTHQPIEQLTNLRSIPNFRVFRPADTNEIIGTWNEILSNPKPSAIVVSRSRSPLLEESDAMSVSNGAYIVKREHKDKLDGIIIATGTEVNIAVNIATELEKDKIYLRVVSMPCMEIYESMSDEYKEGILPAGINKIAIEFGSSYSWYKYVYSERYLINIDKFGKSGSEEDILSYFKLDYDSIKKYIKELLK